MTFNTSSSCGSEYIFLCAHLTDGANRNALKAGILKSDKGCLVKAHEPRIFEQGFLLIWGFFNELPDIANCIANPIRL